MSWFGGNPHNRHPQKKRGRNGDITATLFTTIIAMPTGAMLAYLAYVLRKMTHLTNFITKKTFVFFINVIQWKLVFGLKNN